MKKFFILFISIILSLKAYTLDIPTSGFAAWNGNKAEALMMMPYNQDYTNVDIINDTYYTLYTVDQVVYKVEFTYVQWVLMNRPSSFTINYPSGQSTYIIVQNHNNDITGGDKPIYMQDYYEY